MEPTYSPARMPLAIAHAWRRIGALAVDVLILVIAGFAMGQLFFEPLSRLGSYGRLLGFGIALAYFGFFNSRLRQGQTPGKALLGLRVVDVEGQPLSLPRTLLRETVFCVPFFLNGLPLDPSVATSPLGHLLVLCVFGGALGSIYLYVFNRRTRQSLHDLAAGSFVVRLPPDGVPRTVPPIWKGHLVVLALLGLAALGAPALVNRVVDTSMIAGLVPMQQALLKEPNVKQAGVVRGWWKGNGTERHYLAARLWLRELPVEDPALARRTALVLARLDPELAQEDDIRVVLVRGFDLGFASGWKQSAYVFKPEELKGSGANGDAPGRTDSP